MEGEELLPAEGDKKSVRIRYPRSPESAIIYGITASRQEIKNVGFNIKQIETDIWEISLTRGEIGDLLKALQMLKGVEILQSDL